MIVYWLGGSVVHGVAELVRHTHHLLLNLGKLVESNREDSSENVPVDKLVAGWSCHGSLVDPSVLKVRNFHDPAVINLIDNYSSVTVKFQAIEEVTNGIVLVLRLILVIVINIEEDGDGTILKLSGIVPLGSIVHHLHLKIVQPTINGVLRGSV